MLRLHMASPKEEGIVRAPVSLGPLRTPSNCNGVRHCTCSIKMATSSCGRIERRVIAVYYWVNSSAEDLTRMTSSYTLFLQSLDTQAE